MGPIKATRAFVGWLERRQNWKEYFLFLGLVLVLEFILVAAEEILEKKLGVPTPKLAPEVEKEFQRITGLPIAEIGREFFWVGWEEEALFRLGPLFFAMFVFGWFRFTRPVIVTMLFASSLLFGLVHLGNFTFDDPASLGLWATAMYVTLNQGLFGFLMGTIFLKYCGYDHFKYTWGAFYTVVLMHAAWDTLLTLSDKYFG